MNTATVIAVVGLLSTAATALGVPFVQGRITARNTALVKLHEQRLAAYTDAMLFVHSVDTSLKEDVEDPEYRSGRKPPEVPHQDLIGARLRLLAPPSVFEPWQELVEAWDVVAWNAMEDGPINAHGDFKLDRNSAAVKRVQAMIENLAKALRSAMGVPT